MFDQLVVSSPHQEGTHKPWAVAMSAVVQSVIVGVMILIPLIYTEALPKGMLNTFLVAPAPPPPPPPTASTPAPPCIWISTKPGAKTAPGRSRVKSITVAFFGISCSVRDETARMSPSSINKSGFSSSSCGVKRRSAQRTIIVC